MGRVIAQCPICGKTIIPEEVEIGISLVCPRCEPRRAKKNPHEKQASAAREVSKR
jgi:DNA-directed RNA polymerase subunit M/transcription elongation factor TFIIS